MRTEVDILCLSHHLPEEHYRCVRVPFRGSDYVLCARCLGIVCGLALTPVLCSMSSWHVPSSISLLGCVDWLLYRFGLLRGHNVIRLMAGICIGVLAVPCVRYFNTGNVDDDVVSTVLVLVGVYIVGLMRWITYDDQSRMVQSGWKRWPL
jgi:hypothetical protein